MIWNSLRRPTNEAGTKLTLSSADGWQVAPGEENGPPEAAAMKLSAVNACVEILSNSLGKLPIYVMDGSTRQHVPHDILRLLTQRPNEAMAPFVAMKLVEANRLMGGNGYFWIVRDRATGRPSELIPIPHQLMTAQMDTATGILWYYLTHPVTGELLRLAGEDVVHLKAYTADGIHGISVLHRAADVLAVGRYAQQYEQSYYRNGGHPAGVLETDQDVGGDVTRTLPDGTTVTLSKKDILRAEWNRVHGGAENNFRVAVLDLGLKYQPIAASNVDAQFVESKAVTVEDIARFFGVPLYKLSAGKQSYNSNEQNSIEYVVSTLHPTVSQYEQELTYKLLAPSEQRSGLELRMNMMAELRGDNASRSAWYKAMREIGYFSVNDIAALEDTPDVPGGDTRQASLNYVPLELFRELSIKRNGGNDSAGTA